LASVLIIEDHPMTRRGIAVTLGEHSRFQVKGTAGSAAAAIDWLGANPVDLATVDLSLPDLSGFELVHRMLTIQPELGIVVVTHQENATCAGRALREGAKGFVGKSESGDVLLEALERVLDGNIYISAAVQDQLLIDLMSPSDEGRSPLEVLSTRELDVFEMTGEGLGTREIAERLNLSVKTVESYRRRVRAKLNLPTNPRLVQAAVRWIETRAKC
jgi:DNA-binding NarL/FixJ family response regulator